MRLRKLELKDSPLMLEWMHDDSVVHDMRTNFSEKTLDDCHAFISSSQDDFPCVHRAIVDENDEYMGTVSLKNIDYEHSNAEFAITVRKESMGLGYSKYAMDEMIKLGFEKLNLSAIYWFVSKYNKRALRFYDKSGFRRLMSADLRKQALGGGYVQQGVCLLDYGIFFPIHLVRCGKKQKRGGETKRQQLNMHSISPLMVCAA